MKIILSIQVYSLSNRKGLTYTKSYDSNIAPSVGDKIQDPMFAEHKTITNIVFNYSKDKCLIFLENKEVPDDRLDGHIQEVASLHNWTLSNKNN